MGNTKKFNFINKLMGHIDHYKIKECNIYSTGYANITFNVDGMEVQITIKEEKENA
mgnify:FL=1